MSGHVAKQGYLRRYSKSMLSGGWKNTWVVLTKDSDLYLYKRQGDNEIKGKIHMKEVSKRFAYGQYTSGIPGRPDPPSGSSSDLLLAVPQKNSSKAKIYWFCFYNEADLHEWMQAICSTLPAPSQPSSSHHQPSSHSQPVQPVPVHQQSSMPPPPYSGMPQPPHPGGGPGIGFDGMTGAPPGHGYPPPMPSGATPYPQAPYPSQPAPYPQAPPPAQYAPQAYPQHAYQPPPQQYQQPYGYVQQPGAYGYQQPPQQQVYYQQPQKKSKGIMSSNKGKLAAGLIGGAAAAYGAKKMFGGFGGFGLGRHGSWGSLSSCSWGSGGSWGSFGSFD